MLGEITGVRLLARVCERGREANLSLLFPLARIFRSRLRLSFLTFLLLLLVVVASIFVIPAKFWSTAEITGSNLDDGSPVNFKLDRNTSIGDVLCTGSRVTHRSCVFKNARLHVATKTIMIYIAVPEHMDLREVLNIRNIPHTCASSGCGIVIPGPNPERAHHKEVVWQLKIKEKVENFDNISSECSFTRPAVFWKQYRHNNFGHMMVDNLIPLYIALVNVNSYDFSYELVLTNDCRQSQWTDRSRKNCDELQHVYSSLFHAVSYLDNYKDSCATVAFSRLIIGGGGTGVLYYGANEAEIFKHSSSGPLFTSNLEGSKSISHYVSMFKRTVLENLGLLRGSNVITHAQNVKVMLVNKKRSNNLDVRFGTRSISKIEILAKEMRVKYPNVDFVIEDFQEDFKSQVEKLTNTSVLLSPYGGVGYGAIFLPEHSAFVRIDIPCGGYPRVFKYTDLDYYAFFSYLSYIRTYAYKIEKTDEIVIHTPEDTNKWIALKNFRECLKCKSKTVRCKQSFNQDLYQSDYNIDPNKFGNILELINPTMFSEAQSSSKIVKLKIKELNNRVL